MRTFIQMVEVWVPSKDRMRLEHGHGIYGPHLSFELASKGMSFPYGEGLPGKAWAERRPIVVKNLDVPYFKRSALARTVGVTCGIALPIFAGDFLLAVAIFFCGSDEEHVGAIELWMNNPATSLELGLLDGYYGTAQVFESDSRYIKFRAGFGLPGLAWQSGMPVVIADLGKGGRFLREESARRVGLNHGLAIPCTSGDGMSYVMTFLSALGTPIARRVEVWAPSPSDVGSPAERPLHFLSGRCESGIDLEAAYQDTSIPYGGGLVGRVALTGLPMATHDLSASIGSESVRAAGLRAGVALPVLSDGKLRAVVAWYL